MKPVKPKKIKLPKKKSSSWYRKKLVARAKVKAKERASYACERCGRTTGVMHGSHILPEGAYPLMSDEPENILCLCYQCHFLFWHKSPLEAQEWFNEKWPNQYHKLRIMADEKKSHVVNWKLRYENAKNY